MRIWSVCVLTAVTAQSLAAQGACKPGSDSREAKMLAFFAAPIAFSPAGQTEPMRSGDVRVSVDVTYVPTPDESIRRPEVCYDPRKTENTELSPIFPRPRLALGLGGGMSVEATYLPPVTLLDATPNLFAMALAYARPLGAGSTAVTLRAHATIGSVKGPITCSPDAIQTTNPNGTCYARQPSEDTYKPNMVGLEGMLTFGLQRRVSAYIGGGYTSLRPRFQVGFTDALNRVDSVRVEVDLTRIAAFGGLRFRAHDRTALTAEVYSVPQDVTTLRVGASYVLRPGR